MGAIGQETFPDLKFLTGVKGILRASALGQLTLISLIARATGRISILFDVLTIHHVNGEGTHIFSGESLALLDTSSNLCHIHCRRMG